MNQKFDFWEIYDICASDTGVKCIRLTLEGAELYAKP